jgi:hypothetical protein
MANTRPAYHLWPEAEGHFVHTEYECIKCNKWISADDVRWLLPAEETGVLRTQPYCTECETKVNHL